MVLEKILKLAGNHKIRMGSGILKVAACFVDYESEHLPPSSRIIEHSYAFGKLMELPKGKALDIGCVARHNYISPSLSMNGWEVTGIDIRNEWQFHHPNFTFIQGDIRETKLDSHYFDVVTCISTLEHIGLAGYYGNRVEVGDGDLQAIEQIKRVLKPNGKLILTVPYCKNYFVRPGARIYDMSRLNKMLNGFAFKDKVIYLQDKNGDWNIVINTLLEGVICLELVAKN